MAQLLTGQEAFDSSRRVEYIVPYPHSSNIGLDQSGQLKPFLSKLSLMSIDAAVAVWENRPEARIVIPGETLYGEDLDTTSDLMVTRAKEISEITDDSLLPLYTLFGKRGLNNTYLQTEALMQFFTGISTGVLGITLDYHKERTIRTLKAFDMKPDFVTAESVLDAKGITKYDRYRRVIAGLWKTEMLARLMPTGNRKGALPNFLMEHTGPRIVDIVEDEDGRLKLENDFAHKKQARLLRELGGASALAMAA
jgi:hypothetical protein